MKLFLNWRDGIKKKRKAWVGGLGARVVRGMGTHAWSDVRACKGMDVGALVWRRRPERWPRMAWALEALALHGLGCGHTSRVDGSVGARSKEGAWAWATLASAETKKLWHAACVRQGRVDIDDCGMPRVWTPKFEQTRKARQMEVASTCNWAWRGPRS